MEEVRNCVRTLTSKKRIQMNIFGSIQLK